MKTLVNVRNMAHAQFDLIWKKFEEFELCLYMKPHVKVQPDGTLPIYNAGIRTYAFVLTILL